MAEIGRLSRELVAFAEANRVSPDARDAINLAIEELVTNTISYGVEGVAEPWIDVSLHIEDGCFCAAIADNGHPFNPLDAPPPAQPESLDDVRIGGWGIDLVRQMVDDIHYERRGETNVVTLRKRFE